MNLLRGFELLFGCLVIIALGIAGVVAGTIDVALEDPETQRAIEGGKRERERQRKWRARRDDKTEEDSSC